MKKDETERKKSDASKTEASTSKGQNSKTDVNIKPSIDVADAFDAVLYHVGGFGRYQKILFVLMMPFGFFFAYIYFVQMFIAATPQRHWCKVPALAQLDMELRRNLSAPGAATGKWDKCRTFDVDWSKVLETKTPPPPGTPTIPCKHGWDFELTDIPYSTVVSERGWVCSNSGNVPMAQAIYFLGSVIGCLFFGWLADRFGRLPALMGTNLVSAIGGIATIFTSGIWDFSFCRFLVGMGYDNVFMIVYILVLEYVGPNQRTCVANMSLALYFGLGFMTVPWAAYLIRDWKNLVLVNSIPMFSVVLAPFIIPESARWYVSVGRINQAVAVLRKFERINGNKIPDNVMNEFVTAANNTEPSNESLLDIFTNRLLCINMIFMFIVYMSCNVNSDGLVRLSEAFGLDFFISFTMVATTDPTSSVIAAVLLDILGRRRLTSFPLLIAGIMMTIAMFVPKGIPQASLATVARFCVSMSFNTIIQWATEMLPTTVRASASASLHVSGNVISVLSPYIIYSERLWSNLPLLVLCSTAYVASVVSTMLPETKGLSMPQTMADGEKIIREHTSYGVLEYFKYLKCFKFLKKQAPTNAQPST